MSADFISEVSNARLPDTPELPFFVYGTLKPGGCNYQRLVFPEAVASQARATLTRAALYTDGTYPYLTMSASEDNIDQVTGIVLTFHKEGYAEHLSRIDELERYQCNADPKDCWYIRQAVRVTLDTSEMVEAWVYVAGPTIAKAIESGDLIRVVGGNWMI